MATYHVGCGIAGIYAGTLKKNGCEWLNKNDVTDEAIGCVADYLMMQAECEKKNRYGYSWKLKSGKTLKLIVEIEEGEDKDDNM